MRRSAPLANLHLASLPWLVPHCKPTSGAHAHMRTSGAVPAAATAGLSARHCALPACSGACQCTTAQPRHPRRHRRYRCLPISAPLPSHAAATACMYWCLPIGAPLPSPAAACMYWRLPAQPRCPPPALTACTAPHHQPRSPPPRPACTAPARPAALPPATTACMQQSSHAAQSVARLRRTHAKSLSRRLLMKWQFDT